MHDRRQKSPKAVYMTVVTRAELQMTVDPQHRGSSKSGK